MKLKCYQWKAQDRFQQSQKGRIIAENSETARQLLFARGLQQIKLQQHWLFPFSPNTTEICTFLTQFSVLLQSAVPLKDCLQLLLRNCTHLVLNQWIRGILQYIDSGFSLSEALVHYPKLLNTQERQLIKTGEMSGKLAEVFAQLAAAKQQQLKLQQKLQKILLYPMMVLAISLTLTILLLLFIVPEFAQMYDNNQAEFPFFTQLLMQLSAFLSAYFLQFFGLLMALFVFIKLKLKNTLGLQKIKATFISHTPIFGHIVQLSRLVKFCRNLHLMLHAGIPLQQALQSFLPLSPNWQKQVDVHDDWLLHQQISLMLEGIQQGYLFSDSVSATLFPDEAQQMLYIGEKSGNLEQMLRHIADSYQQQLDHKIDLLSQLLEPLLMLVIGGIIGLIMLGMYMPIFNMGAIIQ